MYTNPKPYKIPDYALAPLLSRRNLLFAAVLFVGASAGGLLGTFNARHHPQTSAQAAKAASTSASAARDAASDARVVAMQARDGR